LISELKNAKVPKQMSSVSAVQEKFSKEDWAFLQTVMTDLSEKEQIQLIAEAKKIFDGTSTLSKEEQNTIVKKIGNYIIIATERGGNTPKWWGQPGHYQLSMAVQQNLGSLSTTHATLLGDYAVWADQNRDQPPLSWLIQNRHSWVLDGSGLAGFDNYGPDSCAYFIDNARTDFNNYNTDSAYTNIGKSLHYIEDLGCPFHTTGGSLPQHVAYEDWVGNNWSTLDLDSAIQVNSYYVVDNPAEDAKLFAQYSNQFLSYFDWEINNDPNWQTNPDMIYYTQVLNAETEKITIGMVLYANKFESPDTVGTNSVPIQDLQTTNAYINNAAISDPLVFPVRINHPDASELEIWLGCRPNSSYSYTDYKIWDRQTNSGSDLVINVMATGFQDMHDWRLQVKDNVAGNEGTINEFSMNIG
jgi:hypothetical protein